MNSELDQLKKDVIDAHLRYQIIFSACLRGEIAII